MTTGMAIGMRICYDGNSAAGAGAESTTPNTPTSQSLCQDAEDPNNGRGRVDGGAVVAFSSRHSGLREF